MQPVLALAVIIWIVGNPWALAVVALLAIAVIAFFLWDASRSTFGFGALSIRPVGPNRRALAATVDELSTALRAAQEEIEGLRQSNRELQNRARAARRVEEPSQEQALFRRVGLHPDAPEWVVASVQRAYRAKLHPDRHPPRLKEAAERRFKEAEAIFDRIEQERARAAA
ncbi:hypothetical protein JNW90_16055 [Micromonospora sp. STR1s_5]|nr:hypothetical protein [Micromonospora sp. STR1s_5]